MNDDTRQQNLATLTLNAIGVVYDDIGTSPLYTMKKMFNPNISMPLNTPHIINTISTIF